MEGEKNYLCETVGRACERGCGWWEWMEGDMREMACLRAKNGVACLASMAIQDEIRVYRMGKIRDFWGDYPCVFGDSQMGKM